MTLILVRHGETALNAARVLQPADTPLSARGLAQAQAAAAALHTTPLLRERDFGELRGRAYDSLGFDPLAMVEAPPGGEAMSDFVQRCADAFAWAVRLRSTLAGPLAVVSHGLVIRVWLDRQLAVPPGSVVPARIGNTAVTVVDDVPPHRVHLVNCMQHLAGATAEDGAGLSGG